MEYFKTIADATSLPIMIYNNPVDYHTLVTLDMFAELAEKKNITAVKESTRLLSKITHILNQFGDQFKILCGVDTITCESLVMGAHGLVAGLGNTFPKETMAIFNLVKTQKIDDAIKIYRWFMPLLELDINAKLVQNIKLAEKMVGIGTEWVRKPRLLLTGDERKQVENTIKAALTNRPSL